MRRELTRVPQDSKGARRGSPRQVRNHRGSTAASLLAKYSGEAGVWGSSGQDVALHVLAPGGCGYQEAETRSFWPRRTWLVIRCPERPSHRAARKASQSLRDPRTQGSLRSTELRTGLNHQNRVTARQTIPRLGRSCLTQQSPRNKSRGWQQVPCRPQKPEIYALTLSSGRPHADLRSLLGRLCAREQGMRTPPGLIKHGLRRTPVPGHPEPHCAPPVRRGPAVLILLDPKSRTSCPATCMSRTFAHQGRSVAATDAGCRLPKAPMGKQTLGILEQTRDILCR